ncbi:unnamed protein product [Commensalibacter communis]|uniref:hypothetical protein n=1 Tax=Commensalibacter communis TaxID=2972786 RepID=UPI0022FFB263|nr:hypothetical protein [Commensalibacter communis]CAI3959731.1 unnamed protein product [Commensalibacter communis]CAI3960575.1 unnamed protein product [Commensalibacter communis]CAI3961520.1 unnamed protein product [Commensalibacter communis]
MIIDYKKLEASAELIHIDDACAILNRSRPSVTRFIRLHSVERVMDGKKSYVTKESLTRALKGINAVSKELLEV